MQKSKNNNLKPMFVSLLLTLPVNAFATSLYNITDLGPLTLTGYDEQNLRIKINDSNKVVGWHRDSFLNNSPTVAFSWDSTNGFQEPVNISAEHAVHGINSNNFSAGYTYDNAGNQQAIMWNADYSTATNLGNLGGNHSQANAINISRQVVGTSKDGTGTSQPFLWSNGSISIVPINNPQGGSADAINDNGWIAGATRINTNLQAFLWDGAEITILNNINSNVAVSWISGINILNQTVGGMQIFQDPNSTNQRFLRTHAFVWDKTSGLTNLGDTISGSSWAIDTNDNQQVVGGRINDIQNRQAILWEDSSAFNLNTLVQNIEDWSLQDATDINNIGNIVGIGKRRGLQHVFLLEPIGGTTATSDLEITLTSSNTNNKANARAGENDQTLSFTVSNLGPSDASNILIESTLDPLLSVSNVDISSGNCTNVDNTISCTIPTMALNETNTLSFSLSAEQTALYQVDAQVRENEIDAGANANNLITKKVKVLARAQNQQAPVVDQEPTTGSSDLSDNSDNNQDKGSSVISTDDTVSSTGSGGCSISNSETIDPIFYLLLIISFLKIRNFRLN